MTKQAHKARTDEGRNIQLDGLRAVAVTLVLLSHYSLLPLLSQGLWGAMGVHAFFVLSGFLITGILLDARDKLDRSEGTTKQALKTFYIRRSLRIFPLYYLFVVFLYVMNVDGMRDVVLYHLGYASNVGMAVKGTHFGHNSHFWSLAVEEQFYLVWPWFVLLLRRQHILPAIAIMAGLAVVYRGVALQLGWNDYALRMITPAVLDSLAAGAFLSVMHRNRARFDAVRRGLVRIGLYLAAPVALAMSVLKSAEMLPYWLQITTFTTLVAWASMAVIDRVAEGVGGRVGWALQSPVLVYLGQRSYAIYLLHLCVPYFLTAVEERLGISVMHTRGLAVLIPTAITLGMAELSWRLLEKPFNNLKRHFDYTKAPERAQREVAPSIALG